MNRCSTNAVLKLAALSWLFIATGTQAAIINYDLTSSNPTAVQNGSGFGNSVTLTDGGPPPTLNIHALGATGTNMGPTPITFQSGLETAEIGLFGTGIGVCNRDEGAGCNNPIHQADNIGADDFVLFLFDQQVMFESITVDPFGTYDTDVSYWVGTVDLTTILDPATVVGNVITGGGILTLGDGEDFETQGFNPQVDSDGPTTNSAVMHALGGVSGNALLFGPRRDTSGKYDDDRFKIQALKIDSVVIPVPAAAWLFGSALFGLVGLRRRP